jgi:hypothetical protein
MRQQQPLQMQALSKVVHSGWGRNQFTQTVSGNEGAMRQGPLSTSTPLPHLRVLTFPSLQKTFPFRGTEPTRIRAMPPLRPAQFLQSSHPLAPTK